MQSKAETVEAYLNELSDERRVAISQVRQVILDNLLDGYVEGMQFGMIGYYIPVSRYPVTYNKQPLLYAALASQKKHMAVYLMGVYGDEKLRKWFEREYKKTGKRMDMGKSCVRFTKMEDLPLSLVGTAVGKLSVDDYIEMYEQSREN